MKEWQKKLSECRRSIQDMKDILNLTEEEIGKLADIEERYPVCVPDYYLGLINPEDRYAQYTKDETERFFRSDWFRFIADYADEAIDTAKKEGFTV